MTKTVSVMATIISTSVKAARRLRMASSPLIQLPVEASLVHIGDDLEADVVPSRGLGMRGIHLSRTSNSPVGPPVISSLHDLLPLIH